MAAPERWWTELPIGAWFYMRSDMSLHWHGVYERTASGYRAICHAPWNTPADHDNMQLIAKLHNEKLLADR